VVELFDVEYYRDLEIWVRGHSRSLKMARFDRPCIPYDFLLVRRCNYSTILYRLRDLLDVEYYCDLEMWVKGTIQKLKLGCGFLFAFHSNYGDILYRLRDIATYW